MNLKQLLIKAAAFPAIAIICQTASAVPYIEDATYLGIFDPETPSTVPYSHANIPAGTFEDWWAFAITSEGVGSASADFTIAAPIVGFGAAIYDGAGTTCDFNTGICDKVVGGKLAERDADGELRWEFGPGPISAGIYLLEVVGESIGDNTSTYTGQLVVRTTEVPAPASLALVSLGLLGIGALSRRRRS